MYSSMTPLLACPRCFRALRLRSKNGETNASDVLSGDFICDKRHTFRIDKGVALFAPPMKNKYEDDILAQYYLQTHYADVIKKLAPSQELEAYDFSGFFQDTDSYYTDVATILQGVAPAASTIVDLGCSVGRLTFECAKFARWAIGVDPSRAHVRLARDILQTGNVKVVIGKSQAAYDKEDTKTLDIPIPFKRENVEFAVADDASLPFANASVDAIVSSAVIDRVPNVEKFIRQSSRVLRPDGHMLITTPFNWQSGFTPPKNWLGKGAFRTPKGMPEDALTDLMKRCGYKPVLQKKIIWRTACDKHLFFTWNIHAALFQKIKK